MSSENPTDLDLKADQVKTSIDRMITTHKVQRSARTAHWVGEAARQLAALSRTILTEIQERAK